jgi:2-keto-3-deoxy-L-rhamnonate aldolase RhmA
MIKDNFKTRVSNGEVVFGGYVSTGSPIAVEILGYMGFDFVFIDTEHAMFGSDAALEHLLRAADATGLYPIVRIKENQEHFIRNALEAGAKGLVIPHVSSRKDAEKAAQYARFPPQGIRGVNPLVRSARWGWDFDLSEYIKKSNEEIMVIALLEDRAFVDNLDDILSADGIDAVAFGPMDYCVSVGQTDTSHPKVAEAHEKMLAKAKERGIPIHAAVIPPTLERTKELISKGARILAIGVDIGGISSAFASIMKEIVLKVKGK